MAKVERYRQYAANARKRATDAIEKRHDILDDIPPGQPILRGHHSQRGHERALERSDRLMRTYIEESERAEYWTLRAARVERRENAVAEAYANNPEGVQIGDRVRARFTNSGYVRQFEGVVVGRTKNDWKVKAITSPYESEEPGRVFKIAAAGSRIHSANNCIEKIED